MCCTGYSISPGNVWVLEVGREYEITVHVFDKFNHPILVTEVHSQCVCVHVHVHVLCVHVCVCVCVLCACLEVIVYTHTCTFFSQNVVMKTDLPTSHLHPLTSSHNESYHIVTAETVGKATIHASLNAVKVCVCVCVCGWVWVWLTLSLLSVFQMVLFTN